MEKHLSKRTAGLAPSLIREISEQAYSIDGIIPLWFGEGCWPTSEIAINAVSKALKSGDHFYQPNSGKIGLREQISQYYSKVYNLEIPVSNLTVTASGMNGLAIVAQALVSSGDQVVSIEPSWPNIAETFRICGANVSVISLEVENKKWALDLERLLNHCRQTNTWIVADDVYSRLYYQGEYAPNFLKIAEESDLLISVNSFSKAWSMTGWRLGWITAPKEMEAVLAMLTEFNIAGPAGFIQAAGSEMLKSGEGEVAILRNRLSDAYALTAKRLTNIPRLKFIEPEGAFYCLFRVEGIKDSLSLAKDLCQKAKVGLAPGIAFGPEGEGCLRLCYAQPSEVLNTAFDRLEAYFSSN